MVQSGQAAKYVKEQSAIQVSRAAAARAKFEDDFKSGKMKVIAGTVDVGGLGKGLSLAAKAARKYELTQSLVKKAIVKKNAPKVAEAVVKKETSAGDVLRSAKAEGQATTARKLERATTFKPETQAQRGVTSTVRPKKATLNGKAQGKKQVKDPKPIVQPGKPNPGRSASPIPVTNREGLKTTTGQRRVRVSNADAKDVSKELTKRPSAPRARAINKPGSTTLTANEKAQIRMRDTVLNKKPNAPKTLQQIKDENKAAKLVRTNKLLRRPATRKVEGPKTERQTKVIENAKKDTPRVPPHKVDVKIMKKKKWKPDTSNAGAEADRTTRAVGKGEKGAYVRQPYKSKAEIREEGNNANTSKNTFAVKPKSDITQGRGNVPQPKPIIPKELTRTERREVRADKKRLSKARTGGPSIVIKQKTRNLIRRDASGKPVRNSDGDLIVNADRRTKRVYPKAASTRPNAKKQAAKVLRNRVKVAEKETLTAEKARAKAEFAAVKKSTRAGERASKKLTVKAKGKLTPKKPLTPNR